MATIQMVNRFDETRGLRFARRVFEDAPRLTAVVWWAGSDDSEPRLLVGFSRYREDGPRVAVDGLSDALAVTAPEAPDFLSIDAVPEDDPRLQALIMHPWTTVPLNVPELTYRFVNVWSRMAGVGQALVYFLKAGDEVRAPLPPALPQAA